MDCLTSRVNPFPDGCFSRGKWVPLAKQLFGLYLNIHLAWTSARPSAGGSLNMFFVQAPPDEGRLPFDYLRK